MSDKLLKRSRVMSKLEIYPCDVRELYEAAMMYEYKELPYSITDKSMENLMVATARHKYTNYDNVFRHPALKSYDHNIVRNRALYLISEEYPFLKKACERTKRGGVMVTIASKEDKHAKN